MPRLPLILTLLLPFAALAQVSPPSGVTVTMPDGGRYDYALTTRPTSGPVTRPAVPAPGVMGFNLDSMASYSPQDAYVDAMKTAHPFGTWEKPENGLAPKDEHGWPTSDTSGVKVFVERRLEDVRGTWSLSYAGEAKVALLNSGASKLRDVVHDPATDLTTAKVDVNSGSIWFRFTGGPVRNVKFLRPGYEDDGPVFTREFLSFMAIVRGGGLRFMDWGATNNSTVVTWGQRAKVGDATFGPRGVPIEHMILLANTVKADPWFCVPHQADDAYVVKLRELVESSLSPDLVPSAEYSNEVWNWIFQQCRWNDAEARRRVAAGDTKLTLDGKETIPGYWANHLYAEQTVRIKKLLGPRFRVVLAGQIGYGRTPAEFTVWPRKQLDYIRRYHGDPKQFIGALAVAPYYAIGATTRPVTAEQYVEMVSRTTATDSDKLRDWVQLADSIGVPLDAYEGGSHNGGAEVLRAQRLPGFEEANARYLANFFRNGGRRFYWFVAVARNTESVTWGASDSVRDQETPKVRAIKATTRVATTRRAN